MPPKLPLKFDGETRIVISLKMLVTIGAFLIMAATGYALVQVSVNNTSAQTTENSSDIRRMSAELSSMRADMQSIKSDLTYLRTRIDEMHK